MGWAAGAANRHDQQLFAPTLAATAQRGLHLDIETLHLDRGYTGEPVRRTCWSYGIEDIVCAPKRAPATTPQEPKPIPLGKRWTIERTNSWLSNFGQLRRNTDRNTKARLGQLALAITLIITIKLTKLNPD
ncbi:transposase [Candidatus Poriferisocius sp.]|uniref:transposase n=1 Tax=Candidatus Poriferisocius sp. TaxID=3101276 RepID=UPI003B02321E